MAQIGSVKLGERRLHALAGEFGGATIRACVTASWMPPKTRPAPSSATGAMASITAKRSSMMMAAATTISPSARRSRSSGSDLTVDLSGLRPSGRKLPEFLRGQHALGRPRRHRGPARSRRSRRTRALPAPSRSSRSPAPSCTRTTARLSPCAPRTAATRSSRPSSSRSRRACPERAMGGWGRRLRIAIKGVDPRNGRPFIWHMFHARPGGGASSGGDGWHNCRRMAFGRRPEVRLDRSRRDPLSALFSRSMSSGPIPVATGQYVGGAGVDLELVVETEAPAVANVAGDGVRHGARGMLGGEDGAPHRLSASTAQGKNRRPARARSKGLRSRPAPTSTCTPAAAAVGAIPPAATADAEAAMQTTASSHQFHSTEARTPRRIAAIMTIASPLMSAAPSRMSSPSTTPVASRSSRPQARPRTRPSAPWTASRGSPPNLASSVARTARPDGAHRPRHDGRNQRACLSARAPRSAC